MSSFKTGFLIRILNLKSDLEICLIFFSVSNLGAAYVHVAGTRGLESKDRQIGFWKLRNKF